MVNLAISCGPGKKDNIPEENESLENSLNPQLNALNEAIQSDPDKADYYFKRAKIFYADKNYRDALKDINQAIYIDNANNNYFAFLAHIYRSLNKNQMALKVAKQAESLNSQDPELFILMAQIYSDLNDKKNADFYLNQSATLAPYHSEIYVLKGNVLAKSGDTAAALLQYQTALNKDKLNLDALEELAKIYDAKKKYDSSMVFIVLGKTINNREPYFDFLSGKVYEHLNLTEAAKAAYEAALKNDSSFYLAGIYLANLYYKRSNFPEAFKWYTYGLKYDSDLPIANQRVGEILETFGRGMEAIPFYERASLIDTVNSKLKISLKRLYALYPDHKLIQPRPDGLSTAGIASRDTFIGADQDKIMAVKTTKTKKVQKSTAKTEENPAPSTVPVPVVNTEKKEEPKPVPSIETSSKDNAEEKKGKGDFILKSLFKKKKKTKDTLQ